MAATILASWKQGSDTNGRNYYYNFVTGEIVSTRFRAGMMPVFVVGEGLSGNQRTSSYSATNSVLTTDDVVDPAFRVRGSSATIVPGEYVELRDAVAYVGDTPVFWFPKYRRRIARHPQNFEFTPGYRSFYGPYLLTTINSYWTPELQTELSSQAKQAIQLCN